MPPKYFSFTISTLALCVSTVVHAQQAEATDADAETQSDEFMDDLDAIIVQADRLRGQLNVEQPPLLELDADDIKAFGAGSLGELIEAIGPQTGSSRGRGGGGFPVFLVNGIRVNGFRELRSYPPEAVERLEVLPEEVAQKFGFRPDRRVINIILKESFSSRQAELEFEAPDRGGYWRNEQDFTLLTINDGARTNFNFEAGDNTLLTEAERDIIQTPGSVSDVASDPDQADFRSLVSDSRDIEASINWAKAFLESGSSVSLNLTYNRADSTSLSGLNSVLLTAPDGSSAFRTFGEDDPLEIRNSRDTISGSATYSRSFGSFQFTATSDTTLIESETEIDQLADTQALIAAAAAGTLAIDGAIIASTDAGFDVARSQTITSANKVTLRGRPLVLPAGEVSATFDLGLNWDRIQSEDTRTTSDTSLTRRRLDGGVNLAIPLTSSREGFLDTLGSFTLNASLGFEDLSDFGTLYDWTAGLNWSPTRDLNLQATYIWREAAPSLANLGNPTITTLNAPIFDFANGETVLATLTTGGNPDLIAETQRDWRISANWQLPFWQNTRLTAEYIRNRSRDVTRSLPALSEEIEAAFPDRFLRDDAGTLIALDRRPVTFDSIRNDRLVFGISTNGSWGSPRPQQGGQPPEASGSRSRAGTRRAAGGPAAGRRGGPPSEEQRARFAAFRERLCAEDGLALLERIATAVENGEDLSEEFPGFDLTRAERMLDRFKGEDGTIDRTRLSQFRERVCSMDPNQLRGGPSGGDRSNRENRGAPPRASRGGRGGNPITSGFGRDGRGRYFASLTHTIELENQILIAEAGPLLDLLDGDTETDFGQARHSTRLETGFFRNGKGLRISGRYTGNARIDGNLTTGTSPLFFNDIATFDLRLFANLGTALEKQDGFLNGLTVSFLANNVFDAQRQIVDINGDTPIRFQPLLLEPNGRYLGVEFRKVF